MSLYSRLDRLAADVEKLNRQVTAVANSPQSQRTSVEGGSIDFNDADGNLMAVVGGQDDGSNTIRHVDGPTPPVPSGLSAHVDGPIVQVSWDGTFEDADTATWDWSHLEVIVVGPGNEQLTATINDVTGATANLAATVSGEWTVVARSVSRAEKRSLDGDAGTVEVKLVDIDGAIEAVQDSANGKNKVTYSEHAPTESDPGIFDDTWFVGQVGRPEDIIEATNFNPLSSSKSVDGFTIHDSVAATPGDEHMTLEFESDFTSPTATFIRPTAEYSQSDFSIGDLLSTRAGVKNESAWDVRLLIGIIRGDGYTAPYAGSRVEYTLQPGEYLEVTSNGNEYTSIWTSARVGLSNASGESIPAGSKLLLYDGWTMEKAEESSALFNGDTESGTTDNESHYRWTGTPHASTSEKYLPALNIGDSDTWNVIEQYRHDGTGWVKVELSHYVFSSVDLGTATVGELDGIRIMGQTVRGEQLSGDAIDGKVITGGTYRTTGGTGSWSDAGLFIAQPDGTSMVRFPTDGSPLSLTASDTQIERASITDLDLSYGAVRSGGELTLASGVTPPASPPELTTGWQKVATLPNPAERADAIGLAAWGSKWVRGVNVLGTGEGDRVEVYNADGTLNKTITILIDPQQGVTVIGDIVYVVGKDHDRPQSEVYVFGYDLNTGARTSRARMNVVFDYKVAVGNDGTNVVTASVTKNGNLYVLRWNPVTGAQVGSDWSGVWQAGGRELLGVRVSGSEVTILPKQTSRVYTVSGGTLTRKTDTANASGFAGWDNPNKNGAGMVWRGAFPCVVDGVGVVYQGSPFVSDATVQMCFTWTNGTYETTPSPLVTFQAGAREVFTVSLPQRAGLSKRLYYRSGTSGSWVMKGVAEGTTVYVVSDVQGFASTPPTVNTFPNADPATLKSTNDKFEVKGDGSGHWGHFNVDANGAMSGFIVTGWVTMSVDTGGTSKPYTINLPAGRFSKPPVVWAQPSTSVPQLVDVGIDRGSISTSSFTLHFNRTTTTETIVAWFAMDSE